MNAFCSMMVDLIMIVFVWMLQRCRRSCTSKTEVGSNRLLGIVGQPMHLLIPVIRHTVQYSDGAVAAEMPLKISMNTLVAIMAAVVKSALPPLASHRKYVM
jgi:hypothetical protein